MGKVLPQIRKDPNLTADQKNSLTQRAYQRGLGLPDAGQSQDRPLNFTFSYRIDDVLSILDGEFEIELSDPFNPLQKLCEPVSTTHGFTQWLNPKVDPGGPIFVSGSPRSPIVMGPDPTLDFGGVIGTVVVPLRRFIGTMPTLSGTLGTWGFATGKNIAAFSVVADTKSIVIEVEINISITANLGAKIAAQVEIGTELDGLLKFVVKPGFDLQGAVTASVGGKIKIPFQLISVVPNNPLGIKQTS